MLVTFKSKGAASILMYEEHAKRLLDLLGKDVKRGVITKDEAHAAIEKLQHEIAVDVPQQNGHEAQRSAAAQGKNGEHDEHEPVERVSFATRAYPLLEMLREADRKGYDVLWGI